MSPEPRLSVVVVVHDMPDQAMRTLQSLSPAYQHEVAAEDYEVIVVENASDQMLAPQQVGAFGPGFRYFSRADDSGTPVGACNAGIAAARGRHVALMVDGARMLTPGLVATTLAAITLAPTGMVSVPGYHLGYALQRDPAVTGYDETAEAQLLTNIRWPADGYCLFDVSVLSGSCGNGFLAPIAETNFLCLPRQLWDQLGGADPAFRTLGGGFVNLDLYRRAVSAARGPLWLLPGEGTFHQFHGGATTGAPGLDRDALLAAMAQEYQTLRGQPYEPPAVEPILFGRVPPPAARFLAFSAEQLALGSGRA